jgi:hypothetical protein
MRSDTQARAPTLGGWTRDRAERIAAELIRLRAADETGLARRDS